jgi:hypothetical protein
MNDEQHAAALDAFLAARLAGQDTPTPGDLPSGEAELAAALVVFAQATRPEALFRDQLEARLHARAARRTTGLPGSRPAWALAVALVLALALLSVPQVRAAVFEVLRIGAVRMVFGNPTPAPPIATPAAHSTVPLRPTATLVPTLLDLAGRTTLTDARRMAGVPIRLPAYPPDLGAPDYVFQQDIEGPVVVLAWTDRAQPARVRLSLHILGEGALVYKQEPTIIAETTVNAERALWTVGPYVLVVRSPGGAEGWSLRRLVTGHVLIWTDGPITYRLETDAELADAVRIAESLK